jgi:flagellar assembly factor FliW
MTEEKNLLLQTKYFGQVECPEERLLRFDKGLFGFEEEKAFCLLPFQGSGGSLLCFQSAATPQLAFVAMNPFSLLPGYAPVLTAGELAELGVERSEELCFYALCVVRSPVGESTVNLRCPIAVNDRTGKAMQAILETGDYHMRHLLSEFGSGKGDGPC